MAAAYELFRDEADEIRWRLRAPNGEIVAVSEGYNALTGALNGIEAVRSIAASAEVEDLT